MTKKAFEAIMAGVQDALAYARGDKSRGVEHQVRVKPKRPRRRKRRPIASSR